MDEPASDRTRGNVVVTIVVLAFAVVAIVVAGILMTRDPAEVSTGDGAQPGGSAPAPAPATCNEAAPVPRPVADPPDDLTAQLQAALAGCPEADVTSRAQAAGWTIRVVERDGEAFAVTMDYLPSRLNLTISGGTVTEVAPG